MGRSDEPVGARANRIMVDNLANGAWRTGFVNSAWVDALPVSACCVIRAIIVTGAPNR